MNKTTEPTQVLVCQGRHTVASYLEQQIAGYQGNPFIESLPPIMTEEQVIESLARYPCYDDAARRLPTHLRLHEIQNALECFVPLPIHLDLEQRFSRMIRAGYQRRNPIARNYWKSLTNRCENLEKSSSIVTSSGGSLTLGFTIVGFPGVGKSTSIEAILGLYPQVVYHTRHAGRDLNVAQVVWLKLECPFDGSPKGLCLNFFQAMDQVLGTNYEQNYAGKRRTTDEMLPKVARVAAIHGLGVIVIDEINRLTASKSGGALKLLSFFVQLTNSIGIPVVLVGTYKAKFVLGGEFHQIRRGTGQGDLVWDRMVEGDWVEGGAKKRKRPKHMPGVWQLLLESLWIYQYTHAVCPLTKELAHALYEETQGITDFAAKIYMLAQIRAIVTASSPAAEVITPDIIRSVARDSLKQAQPVLAALRRGDTHYISTVPDINPITTDNFVREAERQEKGLRTRTSNKPRSSPIIAYGETAGSEIVNKKALKGSRRSRKSKELIYDPSDLRAGISNSGRFDNSVIGALDEAGHIAEAAEHLAE